jgi:hypothetical protein
MLAEALGPSSFESRYAATSGRDYEDYGDRLRDSAFNRALLRL